MKPSGHDRLLGGILADESVERLRASSLAGMLAAGRRRRRRRAIVSGATASLVIVTLAFVLLQREPRPRATIVSDGPPPAATALRVKIINDEQLLALFPGRSVALIGTPGSQRLVFLEPVEPAR